MMLLDISLCSFFEKAKINIFFRAENSITGQGEGQKTGSDWVGRGWLGLDWVRLGRTEKEFYERQAKGEHG